jgi:AcrR family transcriptional regulator
MRSSRKVPTRATRNRDATRKRILAAVGALLAEGGFRRLGINAIAARAQADKVLIYRYFGGLDALLAAYAEEGNFWWSIDELIGPDVPPPHEATPAALLGELLRRHVAALRSRPITLEIMAWEMVEPNPLTAALSAVREQRSLAVMDQVMARFPGVDDVDVAALVALVGAATNYLVIRERGVRSFQGLDLLADGWERLFAVVERSAQAMLGA